MMLIYHRLAVLDVREVLAYSEKEAGTHLVERFFKEFLSMIEKIRTHPRHFPPVTNTALRRANLDNFPYHILFEERATYIKGFRRVWNSFAKS
jgi:hypothetical protein